MDLKDVLDKAVVGVDEANKAFHAGHHEDAESFLEGVNDYMTLYFGEAPPRPTGVTGSAETEKPAQVPTETPAEVPGAAIPATQLPVSPGPQQTGTGSAEPKPPQ